MSPGWTPKSQAVLSGKAGVCMYSQLMIWGRPTQGAVQWSNKAPLLLPPASDQEEEGPQSLA